MQLIQLTVKFEEVATVPEQEAVLNIPGVVSHLHLFPKAEEAYEQSLFVVAIDADANAETIIAQLQAQEIVEIAELAPQHKLVA